MPEESTDYDVSDGLPEDQEDDDDCAKPVDALRMPVENLPE